MTSTGTCSGRVHLFMSPDFYKKLSDRVCNGNSNYNFKDSYSEVLFL